MKRESGDDDGGCGGTGNPDVLGIISAIELVADPTDGNGGNGYELMVFL